MRKNFTLLAMPVGMVVMAAAAAAVAGAPVCKTKCLLCSVDAKGVAFSQ